MSANKLNTYDEWGKSMPRAYLTDGNVKFIFERFVEIATLEQKSALREVFSITTPTHTSEIITGKSGTLHLTNGERTAFATYRGMTSEGLMFFEVSHSSTTAKIDEKGNIQETTKTVISSLYANPSSIQSYIID